ncbi:MAG: glycerol-3-phosphate dehydrogenase, partial [Candidatus Omnitrophica bacterium]|nr:glycerol-3-phosphate dehydrogenase [Candidatus Omnitrophota bacterium]
MAQKRIAIIGDGGWGTTLALLLNNKGYNCILWGAFPAYARTVEKSRINKKFLPGVRLPRNIRVTGDLREIKGSDYYILAVPCQYLRGILKRIRFIAKKPIVSVVKGIETSSLLQPSEIVEKALGPVRLAVLSGPTIAYEVVRGIPTTCVIASHDRALALELQALFSSERFRVYTSDDIVGVELGGALKNIIAIAAGISDGMGFGTNTKSA